MNTSVKSLKSQFETNFSGFKADKKLSNRNSSTLSAQDRPNVMQRSRTSNNFGQKYDPLAWSKNVAPYATVRLKGPDVIKDFSKDLNGNKTFTAIKVKVDIPIKEKQSKYDSNKSKPTKYDSNANIIDKRPSIMPSKKIDVKTNSSPPSYDVHMSKNGNMTRVFSNGSDTKNSPPPPYEEFLQKSNKNACKSTTRSHSTKLSKDNAKIPLDRQHSDPSKRHIKRTPAFRCDKATRTEKNRVFEDIAPLPVYAIVNKALKTKNKEMSRSKSDLHLIRNKTAQGSLAKAIPQPSTNPMFAWIETAADELDDGFKGQLPPTCSSLFAELNIKMKVKNNIEEKPSEHTCDVKDGIKIPDDPKETMIKACQNDFDTLKKVLNLPLPHGPPPKKPPRTFVHNMGTAKSPEIKTKSDPKVMLAKLESVLKQHQKLKMTTKNERMTLTDCVKMCRDADDENHVKSKFYIDRDADNVTRLRQNNDLSPSRTCYILENHLFTRDASNNEPIYAEPFNSNHFGEKNDKFSTFGDNLLANVDEKERKASRKQLHYMCTPVDSSCESTDGDCSDCHLPKSSVHLCSKEITAIIDRNGRFGSQSRHQAASSSTDSSLSSNKVEEPNRTNQYGSVKRRNGVQSDLVTLRNVNNTEKVDNKASDRSYAYDDSTIHRNRCSKVKDLVKKIEMQSTNPTSKPNMDGFDFYWSLDARNDASGTESFDEDIYRQQKNKRKQYVRRVSSTIKRYAKDLNVDTVFCGGANRLFDCCLLIGLNTATKTPYIKNKYPVRAEVPQSIELLCFPDANNYNYKLQSVDDELESGLNQTYSIILTDEHAHRKYAYCRRVKPEGALMCLPLTYCIITRNRASDFYQRILREIEIRHGLPDVLLRGLMSDLYMNAFPRAGTAITIKLKACELMNFNCDDMKKLDGLTNVTKNRSKKDAILKKRPSFFRSNSSPMMLDKDKVTDKKVELVFARADRAFEDNVLIDVLKMLNVTILLKSFASLLLERKIVFVSKYLSKLSLTVEAMQTMLYPLSWQHTIVTILPSTMIDVMHAPMPLIVGVLDKSLNTADLQIDDGLIINLDTRAIVCSCGDELTIVPHQVQRNLKQALQSILYKVNETDQLRDVLIKQAFLSAFVQLLGNYKQYFVSDQFRKDMFIISNPSRNIQIFLEWFTETSLFNAFVASVVEKIDEFDMFDEKIRQIRSIVKKKTLGEKFRMWTHLY